MNDCSELKTNLILKPQYVGEFLAKLESTPGLGRSFVEEVAIDAGGRLYVEEPFGRWDEHREFACILAPFVFEGFLRSVGEAECQWGYYFDGRGSVYEIRFREEIGPAVQIMRERRVQQIPGYLEIGLGQRDSDRSPSPAIRFRFSWDG